MDVGAEAFRLDARSGVSLVICFRVVFWVCAGSR